MNAIVQNQGNKQGHSRLGLMGRTAMYGWFGLVVAGGVTGAFLEHADRKAATGRGPVTLTVEGACEKKDIVLTEGEKTDADGKKIKTLAVENKNPACHPVTLGEMNFRF
jgi:hypothetical protein